MEVTVVLLIGFFLCNENEQKNNRYTWTLRRRYVPSQMDNNRMRNTDRAVASAREIAVIYEYTFLIGALNLKIKLTAEE